MKTYTIYHNPKCSKSRQTLEILEQVGVQIKVIEYLKHPLQEQELLELLNILQTDFKNLVRTNDSLYKENKYPIGSKEEVAKVLAQHPQITERPIVVCGDKAILGRPPENVNSLL